MASNYIYYNNNRNLFGVGTQHEYTPEEIDEIRKCAKDPIYFIKKYIQIVSLDKGIVPFELWGFQEDMIRSFHSHRNTIVLAGRQVGKSTVCTAYYVWLIIFNKTENYTVALLANKQNIAKELLDRAKKAIELLPNFLKPVVVNWNKFSIELKNGSKIVAAATSSSAIRGMSINLLHLDEFAHIQNNLAEDFFNSVYPTISSGKTTKCIIVSTPKGFNYFQKMWKEAEQKKNGFNPVYVPWNAHPQRDDAWREKTLGEVGEQMFAQEYDCDFIGSSDTLIPGRYYRTMVAETPLKQSKTLNVYAEPAFGHTYLMVVDPSQGTGQDSSAFVLFDITEFPITIAATFRDNNISPLVFPGVIDRIGKEYNMAHVLVETNNNGQQVANALWHDLEYDNLVIFGFHNSDNLGIRTNKSIKAQGCTNFKHLVENQKIIINDFNLISEISTFVSKKKSYEADTGAYDDLVMCCVLLAFFQTTKDFKHITDNDIRAELHKHREKMVEQDILPFGFIVTGKDDYDPEKEPFKMGGDLWIFDSEFKM